ncbi:EAL and HDOD domain-containing protein [Undibacterium sp. Ren11W]|uniref:EAL and HDOD domain-containing protein n=1 Tax=Undibacterium sp. Ren11W TaxID=3413045 RepID=UPI003BF304E4
MNSRPDSIIPLASLLPVVNEKQQLHAIVPSFPRGGDDYIVAFLQSLKEANFFDLLPSLLVFAPITNLGSLPPNLDERFSSSRIVLCVDEASCVSPENQLRLRHFAAKGFTVFVDNFSCGAPLVWDQTKNVSINCKGGLLASVGLSLRSFPTGQHLAKEIGNRAQLQVALDAGFKLFSGEYAFSTATQHQSSDGSARTRLLKLLGLVTRDAESRDLEILFKQDTTLSFMLFKLVSSAAFAQTVKVTSFGQAITLLGRRQLQRWLQLLLYARQDDNGGALNPLMLRAAFRASLMEIICQRRGGNKDQQDSAFMIGMFSLLDTLFESSMNDILRPLNLCEDVLAALLQRSGTMGAELRLVELADRDQTEELASCLRSLELDASTYYQCMSQAYVWVNQVCQDM